jgi:hypothetical protein
VGWVGTARLLTCPCYPIPRRPIHLQHKILHAPERPAQRRARSGMGCGGNARHHVGTISS